jgi:hypothetical protein
MQEYRVYILGADGHVQSRFELRCSNETEAIKLAKQFVNGHDVELWQLDRKIHTFSRQVDYSRWRSLILDSA